MAESSGQGGVNLAEILQKQKEQQETIDELRLSIQLLMDQLKIIAPQQDKGKRKAKTPSSEGQRGRSRQKYPSVVQANIYELSNDHHSDQERDPPR